MIHNGSKQWASFLWMIASTLLIPAAVIATFEFLGSLDSEFSNRADLNWGAAYLLEKPEGSSRGAGVIRLLGVPVFDGAQGFGFRLPNFVTIPHLSPLILASRWVPSRFLSLCVGWISLVLLIHAVRLTIRSWHPNSTFLRTLPVFSMALSPVAVYLLYNDWAIVVSGTISSFTLIACLLHKSLSSAELANEEVSRDKRVIGTIMIAAIATQLAGHPRFVFLVVPILLILLKRMIRVCRIIFHSPKLLTAAGLVFFSVCLALTEYRSLGISGDAIREVEPSTLDFLSQGDVANRTWRGWTFVVLAQFFLPIFRFALSSRLDLVHSRVEFLNLASLVAVLAFRFASKRREPTNEVASLVIRSMVLGILWMVVGPTVSRVLPPLRGFFLQDGWDLSYVVAFTGVLGAAITLPKIDEFLRSVVRNGTISGRVAACTSLIAVSMALLLPMGLILDAPVRGDDVPRRDWKQVANHDGSPRLDFSLITTGGRAGFLDPTPRGCVSRETWELKTGLSHSVVLAREGIPTLESFPAFRVGGLTLRDVGDGIQDQIYACDTMVGLPCSPQVLDFMSFRDLPSLVSSPSCQPMIIKTVLNSNRPRVVNLNASGVSNTTPGPYHNFFIRASSVTFYQSFDCSLLNGCLSPAIESFTSAARPPWAICKSDCWFTYQILQLPLNHDHLLLLPARFDDAIEIVVQEHPGISLTKFSYRGLLAVDLSNLNDLATLTVRFEPDSRQWRVALIPYLMLTATVILFIAIWENCRRPSEAKPAEN